MTLGQRDRRALILLGAGVLLLLVLRFGIYGEAQTNVVAAVDSIPLAERRLSRLRQVAATTPGKETLSKEVKAELAARERGIISAETAAQAQAQLLQAIRRIAKTEGIEVRGGEFGQVKSLAGEYGEVSVAVSFECRIEQLVNFLAALTSEPELLATNEIRVSAGAPKAKTVVARVALSGVVPRALIPEKKGIAAF